MSSLSHLAYCAFFDTENYVTYRVLQGPGRGNEVFGWKVMRQLVARLDFGSLTQPLEVRVAISSVDEAGGMNNLAAEPGDFDAVRAKTRAAWQKAVGAVEIAADTPMRTTMYTAL